jgi:hypothetical protein
MPNGGETSRKHLLKPVRPGRLAPGHFRQHLVRSYDAAFGLGSVQEFGCALGPISTLPLSLTTAEAIGHGHRRPDRCPAGNIWNGLHGFGMGVAAGAFVITAGGGKRWRLVSKIPPGFTTVTGGALTHPAGKLLRIGAFEPSRPMRGNHIRLRQLAWFVLYVGPLPRNKLTPLACNSRSGQGGLSPSKGFSEQGCRFIERPSFRTNRRFTDRNRRCHGAERLSDPGLHAGRRQPPRRH